MSVVLQPNVLERGQVRVAIHIEASLNVSAFVAQQKVTGYVLDHVSDHMAADEPSLVVDGEQFMWRVPVQFAVLPRGRLGQVGVIDVDAQTGQLHVTDQLVQEMRDHATALVERSAA
jgi:hypothetical protein